MKEGLEEALILFGPFCLLPIAKQLWRNGTRVELRPTSLAVLSYLAGHPGQVVSGQELLKAVWAGTYVSRVVLRVCVREIRQALEDEVSNPRYIKTVGQQGYRFIGQVINSQHPVASNQKVGGGHRPPEDSAEPLTTDNWQLTTHFVGREEELARLHEWAAQARQGQRRLILLSGEAGIGKSTTVNQFI